MEFKTHAAADEKTSKTGRIGKNAVNIGAWSPPNILDRSHTNLR